MKEECRVADQAFLNVFNQNIQVCLRMLIHDLVDLAKTDKAVNDLLHFYSISIPNDGGYNLALPRKFRPQPSIRRVKPQPVVGGQVKATTRKSGHRRNTWKA